MDRQKEYTKKHRCCGAGAEIILLINIYCSQFGGCKDEEKPSLRLISNGTTGIVQF